MSEPQPFAKDESRLNTAFLVKAGKYEEEVASTASLYFRDCHGYDWVLTEILALYVIFSASSRKLRNSRMFKSHSDTWLTTNAASLTCKVPREEKEMWLQKSLPFRKHLANTAKCACLTLGKFSHTLGVRIFNQLTKGHGRLILMKLTLKIDTLFYINSTSITDTWF